MLGVQWWKGSGILVVHRPILLQQLRFAIPRIVRMREPEEDEERVRVRIGLPFTKVIQDLIGVPGAARFIGITAFGGIPPNGEHAVGRLVGVASFAGSHGVIA